MHEKVGESFSGWARDIFAQNETSEVAHGSHEMSGVVDLGLGLGGAPGFPKIDMDHTKWGADGPREGKFAAAVNDVLGGEASSAGCE